MSRLKILCWRVPAIYGPPRKGTRPQGKANSFFCCWNPVRSNANARPKSRPNWHRILGRSACEGPYLKNNVSNNSSASYLRIRAEGPNKLREAPCGTARLYCSRINCAGYSSLLTKVICTKPGRGCARQLNLFLIVLFTFIIKDKSKAVRRTNNGNYYSEKLI